jgi:hypothetical protein
MLLVKAILVDSLLGFRHKFLPVVFGGCVDLKPQRHDQVFIYALSALLDYPVENAIRCLLELGQFIQLHQLQLLDLQLSFDFEQVSTHGLLKLVLSALLVE